CNGSACSGSFYGSAVSVTLAATDNSGGSGVASIRYTTDGSDPTATTGTVYGGAFSVSATTTVKYRAFDVAGNAEPVNSALIRVDMTPPTSTIKCNGSACSGTPYSGSASVTPAATDNSRGSGVASIRYTTNGTDPTATTGTVYGGAFSVSATTTENGRAYGRDGEPRYDANN